MSWLYSAIVGAGPQDVTVSRSASSAAASAIPSEPPPSYEASSGSASTGSSKPRVPLPPQPLDLPALNLIRAGRFVLASASPRRQQLLQRIGLTNIDVVPSTFAEDLDKQHFTPWEYVLETAIQKCQNVYRREIESPKGEPAVVLAADTVIVASTGQVMEKPMSDSDHLVMLKMLRDGPPHKVVTAVVAMAPLETAAYPGYAMQTHVEETIVKFDKLVTDDLLRSYVKTREGADKAGGYAIQGTGSILIEQIEGTYDNVVGLPLRGTLKILEKVMSGEDLAEEDDEEAEE